MLYAVSISLRIYFTNQIRISVDAETAKEFLVNFADPEGDAKYMNILVIPNLFFSLAPYRSEDEIGNDFICCIFSAKSSKSENQGYTN